MYNFIYKHMLWMGIYYIKVIYGPFFYFTFCINLCLNFTFVIVLKWVSSCCCCYCCCCCCCCSFLLLLLLLLHDVINMCPFPTECQQGKYGYLCEMTCGHCEDNKDCDRSNGTCLRGCKHGYLGEDCKCMFEKKTKKQQNIIKLHKPYSFREYVVSF